MKILCVCLLLFQFAGIDTDRDGVIYYTEQGSAEFTSRVPLHTFTGISEHLTGMIDLEENIVDFYLDLNTLRTGIDRRDRDMFRTLDVDDFPFAEFTGSIENGFDPESDDRQIVTVTGEFTIHGVTQQVEIEGTLQKIEDSVRLKAEWELMLDDYDIEPPGILFYRLNERQVVRIEADLDPISRDQLN